MTAPVANDLRALVGNNTHPGLAPRPSARSDMSTSPAPKSMEKSDIIFVSKMTWLNAQRPTSSGPAPGSLIGVL